MHVERLEIRLLLAADLAVTAKQIALEQDIITYEVHVENQGDQAVVADVSQSTNTLEDVTWRQQNPLPWVIDLSVSLGGFEERTPWAIDGEYGYAIFGNSLEYMGIDIGSGDLNADRIDDLFLGTSFLRNETSSKTVTYFIPGSTDERDDSPTRKFVPRQGGFSFESERWNLGDFNGDDVIDIADGCHVFFGPFDKSLDPDTLNGQNGFVISNGRSVDGVCQGVQNAGDVNGDGLDDLVTQIGDDGQPLHDEIAFIYGSPTQAASVDTAALDGRNGAIWGHSGEATPSNRSTAVGDINGDGRTDYYYASIERILLGRETGDAYVSIDDLPPEELIEVPDRAAVAKVGDLDNDGFGDVLLIAADEDASTPAYRILFGSPDGIDPLQSRAISLLRDERDSSAFALSVAAADVNGDGIDDAVIADSHGHPLGQEFNSDEGPGIVYVLYGSEGEYPQEIHLRDYLDGRDGMVIEGFSSGSSFGAGLATGDFNGDGVDDLLISGPGVNAPQRDQAGAVHVVFGQETLRTGFAEIATSVRIAPNRTVTFTVTGTASPNTETSVTFTAAIADGIEDAIPEDNTFTLTLDVPDYALGDLDRDGVAGLSDFLILASHFGKKNASYYEGDIDGNGVVDLADFVILRQRFSV